MQQKERRLNELELEELVRVRSGLGEIDTGVEQVVRSETDGIGGGRQHSIGKATRIVARGGRPTALHRKGDAHCRARRLTPIWASPPHRRERSAAVRRG